MITLAKIQAVILAAATTYDLDPALLNAIVEVESGYNHLAVGKTHGEIGLFQLRPDYHPCASFDIEENVFCAAGYLAFIKRKHSDRFPQSWFVFYNYGPYSKIQRPRETEYFAKVMGAM